MILGPDGKPAQTDEVILFCPKCNADAKKWVPSGGFGETYMVCSVCSYDFNKELKCQPISS